MFSAYGCLIRALPVGVLNGAIVLVNVFHVTRMLRAKEYFQLLKLSPASDYLKHFLSFILRDCAPIGVFIAREESAGVLREVLDFVIPNYRDLKVGRFLFVEQAAFFRERGIKEIVIAPRTKADQATGKMMLANVYDGRNMDGVKPGEILLLTFTNKAAKEMLHRVQDLTGIEPGLEVAGAKAGGCGHRRTLTAACGVPKAAPM